MTTEEKARAYAENVIDSFGTNGVPCGIKDIKHMITEGYFAGATEALASQWRDPKAELPETDADVVAIDANGLHIAAYFNGEWYSSDDEFTRNPQMWLPIPPLKGDPAAFNETDK
ncbi:MAG: hypothetical protein K2I18_08710 [Paramuribaculum sp.]|nr:hypothetical protein [Paramuribaculum sp.]